MKKVMISLNKETLIVIDDSDGVINSRNYFGLLQGPKKDFNKRVKEFEEQGFIDKRFINKYCFKLLFNEEIFNDEN